MSLTETITNQLHEAADRLASKGLFGQPGDQLSMRIPGEKKFIVLNGRDQQPRELTIEPRDSIHAKIYDAREDAGALLTVKTAWSQCLFEFGVAPRTLFDEQARHIGSVAGPVSPENEDGIVPAIATGSNVALFGPQCICIGSTKDRLVFNAELFQKCAQAFLLAEGTGKKIRTIPFWVRWIAGNRLKKDQRRAAISYAAGKIPEGMNAY